MCAFPSHVFEYKASISLCFGVMWRPIFLRVEKEHSRARTRYLWVQNPNPLPLGHYSSGSKLCSCLILNLRMNNLLKINIYFSLYFFRLANYSSVKQRFYSATRYCNNPMALSEERTPGLEPSTFGFRIRSPFHWATAPLPNLHISVVKSLRMN